MMNSTYWTNQKYCSFYTFAKQVSQHFHKIFIFSYGWSQVHILLFYFDLKKIDTSIIVKILWNLLCQYNNIYAGFYKYLKEKKYKQKTKKKKNAVVFTHSLNKCHNIFTKHLFSVVVGHNFIFYYFILTYKKLTPQ